MELKFKLTVPNQQLKSQSMELIDILEKLLLAWDGVTLYSSLTTLLQLKIYGSSLTDVVRDDIHFSTSLPTNAM